MNKISILRFGNIEWLTMDKPKGSQRDRLREHVVGKKLQEKGKLTDRLTYNLKLLFFIRISVDGGNGSPGGGGGGAGRIAVYHKTMVNFNGTLSAKGGNSNVEPGAAGTIYLERRNSSIVQYRVLKINNFDLAYPLRLDRKGNLRHILNGIYRDIR